MDDKKIVRPAFAILFGMITFSLVSAITNNHWTGVVVGVVVAALVYVCAKK
jgi:general stress protein CsbA